MTNYLRLGGDDYLYMCDYNQVINTCIKDLFLKHAANRKITPRDVDIDEELVKEKIKQLPQLIFESSENCNLRCKYCVYNGKYINQRALSPLDMSFETARKGMDYVYSLIKNRKKKEFILSFYGGEPFLNIKTIKKILEYGKKLFGNWRLSFNLTTNLTLLDDSILDFLVENNFSLLVSLDGDKENHDAKRVFANGKGSHHLVMENLEKIKKRDKNYFDKKVGFSTVYSRDLPLKNQYRFFTTNELIKKRWVRFGTVNPYNTNYYREYPFNRKTFREDFKQIFSQLLEKVRDKEELSGYETFLYNSLKDTERLLNARGHSTLASTCMFDSRVYLGARGRFHICEKVNNTFSFGDIDNGFDFTKMVRIVKEFTDVIKTHCSDCNIRFLCSRCFANLGGNGEFKMNPEFCETQKESVIRNLEKYIECKEEGLV